MILRATNKATINIALFTSFITLLAFISMSDIKSAYACQTLISLLAFFARFSTFNTLLHPEKIMATRTSQTYKFWYALLAILWAGDTFFGSRVVRKFDNTTYTFQLSLVKRNSTYFAVFQAFYTFRILLIQIISVLTSKTLIVRNAIFASYRAVLAFLFFKEISTTAFITLLRNITFQTLIYQSKIFERAIIAMLILTFLAYRFMDNITRDTSIAVGNVLTWDTFLRTFIAFPKDLNFKKTVCALWAVIISVWASFTWTITSIAVAV